MTLYELTGQILELYQMFEEGEYDEEVINDTLESVMFELEDKADAYGMLIRNLEAKEEALKNEIDRLTTKKKRVHNGIERIKLRLKEALIVTGLDQKGISGNLFTFKLRNNAPQLPKEIKYTDVPEQYWKKKDPEIDKKTLLADVKSGLVKGIELVKSRSLMMR